MSTILYAFEIFFCKIGFTDIRLLNVLNCFDIEQLYSVKTNVDKLQMK